MTMAYLENGSGSNTGQGDAAGSKDKIMFCVDDLQNNSQKCELKIEFKQSNRTDEPTGRLTFNADTDLTNMVVKKLCEMKRLVYNGAVEKVEYKQDINCKSEKDASDCIIVGSVMLPGQKLMVTDWNTGNTVKLIDINQNTILSSSDRKLSSSAYGICKISDSEVAVTLPVDKKVVFLKYDPNINVEREIEVNGTPKGIAYLDDKLVVSYSNPDKVEIMDMEGTVIKTIDTDAKDKEGKALFNRPYHVAVHPDNKQIYVSNYLNHEVVTFDEKLERKVGAKYMMLKASTDDKQLMNPRQVAFGHSDMAFVCGEGSHNVHQITDGFQQVQVIPIEKPKEKEKLNQPCSVCLGENDSMLYIGQWGCNTIKEFALTYT